MEVCKGRVGKIALARTVYCAQSGTETKLEPHRELACFTDHRSRRPSSAEQTTIYSNMPTSYRYRREFDTISRRSSRNIRGLHVPTLQLLLDFFQYTLPWRTCSWWNNPFVITCLAIRRRSIIRCPIGVDASYIAAGQLNVSIHNTATRWEISTNAPGELLVLEAIVLPFACS
jgi:hypothetical protein